MACVLRPKPEAPHVFQAPTGATVTLIIKESVGSIVFLRARYGDRDLVADGQSAASIQFNVIAGRNVLMMVFGFSETPGGRGELHEDCGDGSSTRLRNLSAADPAQNLTIEGV